MKHKDMKDGNKKRGLIGHNEVAVGTTKLIKSTEY